MKLSAEQKNRLNALGEVTYFDSLPNEEELIKRVEGADVLCVDWAPIDKVIPRMKPGVKLVSVPFTGVGFLPLKEATEKELKLQIHLGTQQRVLVSLVLV